MCITFIREETVLFKYKPMHLGIMGTHQLERKSEALELGAIVTTGLHIRIAPG